AKVRAGEADRIGIVGSSWTPSRNNRLLERHDLGDRRYYWKSYDFADNSSFSGKDLLSTPLGPATDGRASDRFRPDGMEIIIGVRKGLQAYLIANARGERLDQAPIEIVQDALRRQASVVNGVSCMNCHALGLRPAEWNESRHNVALDVTNHVRTHIENGKAAFSNDFAHLASLYKSDNEITARMEKDVHRFTQALADAYPDPPTLAGLAVNVVGG